MQEIPNLSKIIKLLNLTQSENDYEALLAMRHANAILKKSNADWKTLLTPKASGKSFGNDDSGDTFDGYDAQSYAASYPGIQEMLSVCLEQVTSERSRSFLESLRAQYVLKRRLSAKQKRAIEKFYDNCR